MMRAHYATWKWLSSGNAEKRSVPGTSPAKHLCSEFYADPNWSWLAWGRQAFEEEEKLLGPDPWPHGLETNRANLERFVGYSPDQGLMMTKMAVEELFLGLS